MSNVVVAIPSKINTDAEVRSKKYRKTSCAFAAAIEKMDLDEIEKLVLQNRFICLMKEYERRALFYAVMFHVCRFLVTVGSLIVPALLSIQYTDTSTTSNEMSNPEAFAYQIYWATWVISLLVTTSNGIATVFKFEKKYYFLHTTLEQLKSEGWQFLMLTGRYSGFYTPGDNPTHKNQYVFFCHTVEKIKMKQVTEEYFKIEDQKDNTQNVQKNNTSAASLAAKDVSKKTDQNQLVRDMLEKQLPAFLSESLMPPTPELRTAFQTALQKKNLEQILQALAVDGGRSAESKSLPQPQGKTNSEVPVRSELHPSASSGESFLSEAQQEVPKDQSIIRVGAEIPTKPLE